MTRYDLFISHSSSDAGTARELRTLLESAGYACWMAPDDVTGTDPWAQQILAAIENSRAMLVLISERSNQSLHVSREVELASSRGRIILPVRVEPIRAAGALEYHLAGLQRIDVFPLPVGDHREEILRRLAVNVPLAAPSDGAERAPVTAVTRAGSPTPPDGQAESAASRKPRGRGFSAWARANSMVAGSIVTLAALFLVATLGFALSSPQPTTSPGPSRSTTGVVPSPSVASTKPPTPSPTAASTFAPPQSGFPVTSGGPFPNVAERALFDALPETAKSVIEACDRNESRYDVSVVGISCHADDGELLFYEGYADHTTQYRQYLDVVRAMNNPEGSCSTSPGGDEAWSRPDGRFGHLACGVTDSDLFFFFWSDESRLFSIGWYSGYEVNLSVERAKGYQVFLDWTGGG